MSCTRHFLGFHWDRHQWERRVVSTEYVPTQQANMWSRPVYGRSVLCNTEYVCTGCGATRRHEGCICDTERGETCPARLAFLAPERVTRGERSIAEPKLAVIPIAGEGLVGPREPNPGHPL